MSDSNYRVKVPTHGGSYYAIRNRDDLLIETGFLEDATFDGHKVVVKCKDDTIDASNPAATVPTGQQRFTVFDGDKGRGKPTTRPPLPPPAADGPGPDPLTP